MQITGQVNAVFFLVSFTLKCVKLEVTHAYMYMIVQVDKPGWKGHCFRTRCPPPCMLSTSNKVVTCTATQPLTSVAYMTLYDCTTRSTSIDGFHYFTAVKPLLLSFVGWKAFHTTSTSYSQAALAADENTSILDS